MVFHAYTKVFCPASEATAFLAFYFAFYIFYLFAIFHFVQNDILGFVFVILSVAKDLKQHKVKMCETRFFA